MKDGSRHKFLSSLIFFFFNSHSIVAKIYASMPSNARSDGTSTGQGGEATHAGLRRTFSRWALAVEERRGLEEAKKMTVALPASLDWA